MSEKLFVCECGKAFAKSQSFNGHKSSCNVHIKAKYYKLSVVNDVLHCESLK